MTQGPQSWANYLGKLFEHATLYNLGRAGAGNQYIASSIVEFLIGKKFTPSETMVIAMWSGVGRKDLRVTGEMFYCLKNDYGYRYGHSPQSDNQPGSYFVFSGGLNNSWNQNSMLKNLFSWSYKSSDPSTMIMDSVMNFVCVENFLRCQGYNFVYTSAMGTWNPNQDCTINGDYAIPRQGQHLDMVKNYSLDHWVFADNQCNGICEFANDRNQLDSTSHPTSAAHQAFADEIMYPAVSSYL